MDDDAIEGFRLSPQQRWSWRALSARPSAALGAACVVRIDGEVDPRALRAALLQVVEQHEVLRTVYLRLPGMGEPLQVPRPAEIAFQETERPVDEPGPDDPAERLLASAYAEPCALDRGPVLRATLAPPSPEGRLLALSVPALAADRASLQNLCRAIALAYEARLGIGGADQGPVQYADYAEWRAGELEASAQAEPDEGLDGDDGDAPPRLPFERPDAGGAFAPRCVARPLPRAGAELVQSAWFVLLARLAASDGAVHVVVDVVSDGRDRDGLDTAIGLFAEAVPCAVDIDLSAPFAAARAAVVEAARRAREGRDARAAQREARRRHLDPASRVLFEIREPPVRHRAGAATFTMVRAVAHPEPFALALSFTGGDEPGFALHYDGARFDREDVEGVASALSAIVCDALARPEQPASAISLLERGGARPGPRAKSPAGPHIHRLFEAHARRSPDSIAVVEGPRRATYAELNAHADRLARELRASGVQPGQGVGLLSGRSLEMVAGMLAVMKAGAYYVALEPALGRPRVEAMWRQARASVLLSGVPAWPALPGVHRVIPLDLRAGDGTEERAPDDEASDAALAYVVFTSGSSGVPKGVAVEHRQLRAYVDAIVARLEIGPGFRFMALSSFATDLAYTAVYPALSAGGCLHIASHERAVDPSLLAQELRDAPVDGMKITPSHLEALLAHDTAGVLPRARLVCGGEPLPWELVDRVRAAGGRCVVVNHYGPTETTVGALAYVVPTDGGDRRHATVPLGLPLASADVRLLDDGLEPVPSWFPGEIYVSGDGVARGYLDRPDLTAERFLPDPWSPGARMYRTGDVARRGRDGCFEFLGRRDRQIKIRGHRVELGEIEAAVAALDGVARAAVVWRVAPPDGGRLVAYVVPSPGARPREADLRGALAERLPDFMVPGAIVLVEDLPRTPGGKLDRGALPAPGDPGSRVVGAPAPAWAVAARLAAIWAEVLGVAEVGLHDDFFELGGHSLLAMRIAIRIREAWKIDVTLVAFFDAPTVSELASIVERAVEARGGAS